ncbi:peptidoglycan-binding protein [Rhizobium sp. Root274]|uniref:peptidoglycan DD-metalloendopeptidase family protein n=1 Tax=unclassified Rhizobium TaxID=2613769 RepID=UPI000715D54F|nr:MULTISPECIES: peptidoglycan DD-metalloendopeptidase family protein [unclassified Rhizobium]KQW27477.1 peptidoglycan-binding protein [Rhizobium sp. Root1240]KRD27713.1 peptidoglycan-binding protein [Rhizobium sp. Root274]
MRNSVSPKAGLPVVRICGAILLAGTVAGCSSDASRFTSVFSTDNLTTASIPRGQSPLREQPPVPAENIGGSYGQSQAMAQPAPTYQQNTYQQNTYQPAAARAASTPAAVQRAELSAPSGMGAPAASNNSERAQALAQPFPSMPAKNGNGTVALGAPPQNLAEPSVTGSTPTKGQWSTANAARVTLRPGETIATLASRYGVPEREILKANGLTHSSDAATGQLVVIPSLAGGNAARAAADASGIPDGGKPGLPDGQQQNVAVLPTVPGARDKQQASTLAATGKTPAGAGAGTYVVKPGDSIARIAQQNGVSTAELKKVNGLTTGAIRIGQVLTLPQKSNQAAVTPVAADPMKTASVPSATQPGEYKAPTATKSVSEVASVDPESSAPQATGIGKYRWPARGAIIANFGSNIDGKRSDGIAISVPTGTPIKAAENGVVIYAGNGLKELGNTVLIRHDDGKVTVYGHADSLSVQRGQKVQRGQTIATSGMSGNVSRPMLHFEVRKDAAPVNPITYLE